MQKLKQQDLAGAKQLFKHAQGCGPALRELAKIYLKEGKVGRAFYWKCMAQWMQDPLIQTIEFPSDAALQCLMYSAKQGNLIAAPTAAIMYRDAKKPELEFNARFSIGTHGHWFDEAETLVCLSTFDLSDLTIANAMILADAGIPYAQFRCGKFLMSRGDLRGREYLRKAGENDVGLALFALGELERDKTKQLEFWKEAVRGYCQAAERRLTTLGVPFDHLRECEHRVTGRVFLCKDCVRSSTRYCCGYCAEHCHEGHSLIDVGRRYEFQCSCTKCGNEAHDVGIPEMCSFAFGGDKIPFQRSYDCITCQTDRTRAICRACAGHCHGSHWTNFSSIMRFACCCGSGGMNCEFSDHTEIPIPPYCTFGLRGKRVVGQRFYQCHTCSIGCCQKCATVCHKGHHIEYCGFKRSCCACGQGGNCQAMPAPVVAVPAPLVEKKEDE
jgi:hypothetical protein